MQPSDSATANIFVEYIDKQIESALSDRRSMTLGTERFIIGRAPNCHLRLPHRAVSRHHAEIVNSEGRYYLVDLGSTNGTTVNGKEAEPHRRYPLKNDDQVQVADILVVKFEDPSVTTVVLQRRPLAYQVIWLDVDNHRVFVRGQQVEPSLSDLEFRLLHLLYERRGSIVSRDQIADIVWSQELGEISEDMIYNTVRRLRERLKSYDEEHQYIETVRGIGYRLSFSP